MDLWRFIQYDVGELLKELGKLFWSFAMEDAEDPGDHLELDGFQFAFLRLFRRVEPICNCWRMYAVFRPVSAMKRDTARPRSFVLTGFTYCFDDICE